MKNSRVREVLIKMDENKIPTNAHVIMSESTSNNCKALPLSI